MVKYDYFATDSGNPQAISGPESDITVTTPGPESATTATTSSLGSSAKSCSTRSYQRAPPPPSDSDSQENNCDDPPPKRNWSRGVAERTMHRGAHYQSACQRKTVPESPSRATNSQY